ncbi:MAG TPA: hypothetical protein VGU68_19425 [Ktedonobacteraceae bacterium]|nr:hypothetical protein [Ktedonobacteraceae bacterium]
MRSYRGGNALERAKAARLDAFRTPVLPGSTATWQARWQWKNEWIKALEAEKAAADPRLVEIWKGEPHGKATS